MRVVVAMADGTDPTESKRRMRGEMTLAELCEEFLARKRNKRGRPLAAQTIRGYRSDFKNFARLASTKISAITPEQIKQVYLHIGNREGHPTQANRVRAMIRSMFEYAVATGALAVNPAAGVRKIFAENERERFLQSNEVQRFFAALNDEPDELMRTFFKIVLFTGARRSNVMAMRWNEIDLDHRLWRIPHTKNGTPQFVTLTGPVIEILTEKYQSKGASPFVFPGTGATGHMTEPKRAWQRLLERDELSELTCRMRAAGAAFSRDNNEYLPTALTRARKAADRLGIDRVDTRLGDDLRIHDLRRTMGSWMAKTGASLLIIGKSLNHLSPQSTKIYARLDNQPVRDAMETATATLLRHEGGERF